MAFLGLLCCISCNGKDNSEASSDSDVEGEKADLESFVERYSHINIGEDDKARYAFEMPSYDNIKKEYNSSIEKLTDYLTETYIDDKRNISEISSDKTYERLAVKARVNASMMKFYRLSGYYVSRGLSRKAAKDIEETLDIRKEVIDKLINEGSKLSSEDITSYLLRDAQGKAVLASILPTDVPKSVIVNGYAWDSDIISYLEKICK